ncbi:hypothetical protein KIN20_034234 [Parelaphostrongylus tenuis]|uniref:Uncharacterized protein n=1 Tax=Parelaphostrongylus tenuis TaxID=148309 RepID=A0AAD5WJK3_PARTN|nr:hypothetical protein KIN20_034234 [Parelaphostrongylus tenuis]
MTVDFTNMSYEVIFVDELPTDCTCPVCEQALRAAVITKCGHYFCKQCIVIESGTKPCPVCHTEITWDSVRADRNKQRQVQSLPVKCPFVQGGCSWTGTLKEMQIDFHRLSCPNADVCPFAELGCDHLDKRVSVQEHLAKEPIRHLMYLCDAVTELKNSQIAAQMDFNTLKSECEDLMRKATTANQMYGAQLVWKIENVVQKQNEAKSGTRPIIYSEPFLSGRYGYKLIASACLYGDGQYRGKYLAVYLTILRGKYDQLLTWPFEHVVSITLLDQNPSYTDRCDISYLIDTKKITEKN